MIYKILHWTILSVMRCWRRFFSGFFFFCERKKRKWGRASLWGKDVKRSICCFICHKEGDHSHHHPMYRGASLDFHIFPLSARSQNPFTFWKWPCSWKRDCLGNNIYQWECISYFSLNWYFSGTGSSVLFQGPVGPEIYLVLNHEVALFWIRKLVMCELLS